MTGMLVVSIDRALEGSRRTKTNDAQWQVVIDQRSNSAVSCDSDGMGRSLNHRGGGLQFTSMICSGPFRGRRESG